MNAAQKNEKLARNIQTRTGVWVGLQDAATLRRAQITLHRWDEAECGDSNERESWCIVRDEEAGKPYREVYPNRGQSYRTPINDLEAGALRRIVEVCERNGLHYYHQGDCRGCSLYVHNEPLNDGGQNQPGVAYTHGVACVV